MKLSKLKWGLLLAVLLPVCARGDLPAVRLAIVPESSAAASAGDLLTMELSSKPHLQLLERAEIEKVYREQGLAAENNNYLKLGQILGADGLLLWMSPRKGGAKNSTRGWLPSNREWI